VKATLLVGATVVTMSPDRPTFEDADILIHEDQVVEVGSRIDPRGADVIDLEGRILCPGFVNAHLHTWQTALRGVGPDWTLLGYLSEMHMGFAGRFQPEDSRLGTLAGALGQLDQGTTTIGDWAHNCQTYEHAAAAIQALAESGIRARFLHGTPYRDGEIPHPFEVVDRLVSDTATNDLVDIGIAAQGPQYSSVEVVRADFAAALARGMTVSIHQSGGELAAGWDDLRDHGLFGPNVNIVHGIDIPDRWLDYLLDRGVTFTSTPENELGQGHGTPILSRVLRSGNVPSIGTDTEAVVAGDIRTAARMAIALARGDAFAAGRERGEPMPAEPAIPGWQALEWITTGGAKALGLADRVGQLVPGMQADLVVVNHRGLFAAPAIDPVGGILQADRADIEAVMVAGAWRKWNHEVVGVAVDDVMGELSESATRLGRGRQGPLVRRKQRGRGGAPRRGRGSSSSLHA